MKPFENGLYLKRLRQAVDQFELIDDGDRILVGVSGGKDSTLLFHGLTQLSKLRDYDFTVTGLTVNHGMLGNLDEYVGYCKSSGLDLMVHHEDYAKNLSHDNTHSPCYTCSRLRKGIVKRIAIDKGYNKIAYGHTKDDVVETFLMNIIKHGKIAGIPAISKDPLSNLLLVRPLVLIDEKTIIKAVDLLGFPLMKDLCQFAKGRIRQDAETLIGQIELTHPEFSDKVIQALQNVDTNRLI
ncbi:MAG: tRNA 2-thiocytidine biosynthesis protein TtcA [Clostridia bacterium]|nr:tRNA 2-thiocytidine biosynthesis protein TtcA [Clostridia bacterium]